MSELKPWASEDFRTEVQNLILIKGYRRTAQLLHDMGISFDDAYTLIFSRNPRR